MGSYLECDPNVPPEVIGIAGNLVVRFRVDPEGQGSYWSVINTKSLYLTEVFHVNIIYSHLIPMYHKYESSYTSIPSSL